MNDSTRPGTSTALQDLIDVGANLTHESFTHDLPEVLERALHAGVSQMVVTGSSVAESDAASALARAWPGRLFATAGVHPHHARDWNPGTGAAVGELCMRPEVVAVGEAGLDFYRDLAPRADQERAFHGQLEIAARAGKPVFMHERDAFERFIGILREHRSELGAAVVHCFTGAERECDAYLELDLHIGITGWICDERRGEHLRDVVRRIPPGRLMLETDAPYLLPRDLRPRPRTRRNEPMHLPHILSVVARCTAQPAHALARASTSAARSFFGLPRPQAVLR